MNKLRDILINPRSAINISFIIILLFVGFMLNTRLRTLMYDFTENQVARQAEVIAEKTAGVLMTEMEALKYRSSVIENKDDDIQQVMQSMSGIGDTLPIGLLATDGSAVFGERISPAEFSGVQSAFRGNGTISYNSKKGLLFCWPVFHGENIKYVMYELCPLESIRARFSVSCFDGMGKALVTSRKNEVIIPFNNASESDIEFFYSSEMSEAFELVQKDMERSASAAQLVETAKGEYYVFSSEMPEMDFCLSGFVESDVAAAGANDIVRLVTNVFALITILFVIGCAYLILTSARLSENEELLRAKQVAEEASRAKSDFLASMSHEIRTPINAILGMDELIIREYDDSQLRQYALNIRNAGNTLMSIINDILDFSKIESGKMELVPVEYDVPLMIYDLVSMEKPRAEKKDLTFIVNADENIPRTLYGDNIRIKQCILNLLTNAVKYTEQGCVAMTVGFEQTDRDHIKLRVSVKDTGIGIKPEDIERLFTPFERVDLERNRSVEGTGLGMSIVKRLLAMMDSQLEVTSEYGKGSEFSFEVLQEVRDPRPMGNYKTSYDKVIETEVVYHEQFIAPEARILIVDDIEMNLTVASGLLKKTEIQVDTALGGKEALELTAKQKYDVLFIDDRMPGMSGGEMLRELRSRTDDPNSAVPCIVLTANAIAGARDSYMKLGFEDYLSKPIDGTEFEKMLQRYLPKEKVLIPGSSAAEKAARSRRSKSAPPEVTAETMAEMEKFREYIGEDDKLSDAMQLLMSRTRKH